MFHRPKDLLAGSIIQSSLLRRLLVDSFLIPFLISFMASRLLLILLLWLRSSSRKVGWVSEGEGNTFGEVEGLPHYQNKVFLLYPHPPTFLYTQFVSSLHHIDHYIFRPFHHLICSSTQLWYPLTPLDSSSSPPRWIRPRRSEMGTAPPGTFMTRRRLFFELRPPKGVIPRESGRSDEVMK